MNTLPSGLDAQMDGWIKLDLDQGEDSCKTFQCTCTETSDTRAKIQYFSFEVTSYLYFQDSNTYTLNLVRIENLMMNAYRFFFL